MKPEKAARKRRLPWRRILLLPAVLLLAVAAYFIESRSGWSDLYRAAGVSLDAPDADLLAQTSTTVTVLDVGQGDGMYLHTKEGTNFFFDGGSTDVSKVGTYRMLPFLKAKGVKKIDYWIVSHTDADHISGLKEILQAEYEINHIVFSKYVLNDEAYQELLALAQTYGTEILKMDCGDTLTDGEAGLRCISRTKLIKVMIRMHCPLCCAMTIRSFPVFLPGTSAAQKNSILWNTKRLAASHFTRRRITARDIPTVGIS